MPGIRKSFLAVLISICVLWGGTVRAGEAVKDGSSGPASVWNKKSVLEQLKAGVIDPEFRKFFDRDPERIIPKEKNIIVSPADGKIVRLIDNAGGYTVIIHLSLFDVHIQRIPISGTIVNVETKDGEFLPATDERSLVNNFQVITTIKTEIGIVKVIQITGLHAKRIKTYVKPAEMVNIGKRLGRIMLGSTVVLILPKGVKIDVALKQKVYGGQTVIAKY